MRISDWSSDVCSSDLSRSRLLRPPPATARRRGCGYPPRRGRGAAAATPGATASCIHQPAAVEPQHAAAARGEVFVVGHQYQRGARVGVHREQQLDHRLRSEEHTSELQSLMRSSYAVFSFKNNMTRKIKTPQRLKPMAYISKQTKPALA